ncbi:MAG: thioredoxin [bacterium]|jgi:thioredoxin 1
MSNLINATDSNFQNEVLEAEKPVLVDFWAPWCGPCRMVGPVVEQIAGEYQEKMKVVKVNVDDNPQTAAQYGVMSIPTLVVFKDGKAVQKMVGYMPKEQMKSQIDQVL